jgi:flagellar FliL protein
MSGEAKTAKSDGAEAAPVSAGGGKIGTILSIMNLLLTLGIGAVVFLQFQKDKHRETVSDIQPNAEVPTAEAGHGEAAHGEAAHGEHGAEAAKPSDNLITLDQFTVNLSTSPGTPPRFARVTVAIEVSSGDAGKELNAKMAPVRNAILDLFNSKRPADLQTGEGRNFLKEEIRNALNGMLVSGKVKAVFFSAFQVST